jgi:hypothetical protein
MSYPEASRGREQDNAHNVPTVMTPKGSGDVENIT